MVKPVAGLVNISDDTMGRFFLDMRHCYETHEGYKIVFATLIFALVGEDFRNTEKAVLGIRSILHQGFSGGSFLHNVLTKMVS